MENTTLKEVINNTNKFITDNTNIVNGRSSNYKDFFDDNDARKKLIEMMDDNDFHKFIPYADRGNTLHIKDAGITLFMKKKRISFKRKFSVSNIMIVVKIEVKEDLNNLADKTLDEIVTFIKKQREDKKVKEDAYRNKQIYHFTNSLDDKGITIEEFFELQKEYAKLSYPTRIHLEREVQ